MKNYEEDFINDLIDKGFSFSEALEIWREYDYLQTLEHDCSLEINFY